MFSGIRGEQAERQTMPCTDAPPPVFLSQEPEHKGENYEEKKRADRGGSSRRHCGRADIRAGKGWARVSPGKVRVYGRI
jgi:hypothetical protein